MISSGAITTLITLISGSEQEILGEFLGLIDQFNPLPQSVRTALTTPLPLLDKTLLDAAGAGDLELLVEQIVLDEVFICVGGFERIN